jgi:hypothetical protein
MPTRLHFHALAAAAALLVVANAGRSEATVITFEVTPVAGNTFEYTYVVENDTLASDLEEITVYFDVDLFENLRFPATPPGWDPVVVQPDTILQDDGFFDALALVFGIPPGGRLGGFTIVADFLGAGSPGRQRFEILDPLTFDVLDSGFTVPAVRPIPEPTTVWLVGLGLAAALVRRKGTAR